MKEPNTATTALHLFFTTLVTNCCRIPFFNKHSLQVSQCSCAGHSDMNSTPRLIPQVFKKSSLQGGHAISSTRKYTSLNIMFLCIFRLECTCCWHQRKQVWPWIMTSLMRPDTGYEQIQVMLQLASLKLPYSTDPIQISETWHTWSRHQLSKYPAT